jgi:hypothetical protein
LSPKPLYNADPEKGGVKHDEGKRVYAYLPYDAIEEVLKVLELGADKYGKANWTRGMDYSRAFNAAQRHQKQWFYEQQDLDPESGITHLAHAVASLLFLITFQLKHAGNDDRAEFTGAL